jgi:hypothetical protein
LGDFVARRNDDDGLQEGTGGEQRLQALAGESLRWVSQGVAIRLETLVVGRRLGKDGPEEAVLRQCVLVGECASAQGVASRAKEIQIVVR